MWRLAVTEQYQRKKEWFSKKHPGILIALLNNVQRCLDTLNLGTKPAQLVKLGHVHNEKYRGLIAVDQRGASRKLRETRLYLVPEEQNMTIHLITIGFKDTQRDDHKICRTYVDKILEEIGDG